ncbi:MAG TPA: acetate/propionate family kinase [Terriglobia bacterium]|nr:acetate/propionate family kinase [Terriglobia bacterium]
MDTVVTINGGSSSLRFALFRVSKALERLLAGKFDRIGTPDAVLKLVDIPANKTDEVRVQAPDHIACVPRLVQVLEQKVSIGAVTAIGHRVVHGGARYRETQRVDEAMLEELRRVRTLDPAHLPSEIALIESFLTTYPSLPQIVCFDTTFHRSLPRVARLLPIPRRYEQQGVQRYGFHGLSYSYLMEELERVAGPAAARGRIILAHLGNGASMAAVHEGQSIDTTMAFTPAAGLVMGTRSGDIDPGLVAWLARTEQMTPLQFDEMVTSKSGLAGVSEISSDVRELLQRESSDVRAADAIALFCYQARKWIGALAAALGGLDTLIFSGAIGENSAVIRGRICEGLEFLGIEMDQERNAANAAVITGNTSPAAARVIRTDEELYIAQSVVKLIGL